ncbi:MAG: hypothetical protein P9M06_05035 [Candidatus Saelkia tenebricola]|nr:hypothetical protein [Candidatus Saelkia tenebricola]
MSYKIRILALAAVFLCLFNVTKSEARRVKGVGVDLYSWSAEEVALVREGYVLIYDSNTGQRIGTFNRHVPTLFLAGHDGIVVKKRLDSGGFFSLGLPKMHYFPNYPSAFVVAEIPFNYTVRGLSLYNDEGVLLKNHKIIKIFSAAGELIDCHSNLSSEEFSVLNNVSIETELDSNGYLQIGGQIRGHFEKNSHSKVLVKVHQGVITSVSFLNQAGDIFETKEYSLLYDKNFNLIDSFRRRFPENFLKGSFYVQRSIGENGKLSFRGREIISSEQYVNCAGFMKIINGSVEGFWIVNGDEVIAGRAPSSFNAGGYINSL